MVMMRLTSSVQWIIIEMEGKGRCTRYGPCTLPLKLQVLQFLSIHMILTTIFQESLFSVQGL